MFGIVYGASMSSRHIVWSAICALVLVAASARSEIDGKALANEADGHNWPSYGRTYSEQHSSPLAMVNRDNVGRLGLSWSLDLGHVQNGATVPLAVDGILYFTVGQSLVHAVDARSGKLLWRHDPEVAKVAGRKLRYTWGPRGIAYWQGRVFVGTTDGRLIALSAKTGHQVWSVQTTDKNNELTITGPPRVFGGRVIIGNAGSEWGPNRGYVTAYDTATGRQLWRFYTVPGNPADGFESDAMAMAAKTWTGEWWKIGGGGTVWNAITYDPELDRIYIGVGNGAPWNRKVRSPLGGDNLFLCAIVALDAATGRYVWHYQTTPGESWDFVSAMDITLATVPVDGVPHKVILHAPKNGFFYVLDRYTGKVLSAEKLGKVTWAERVDLTTGRPVEAANARYPDGVVTQWPSSIGVHNWQPMSFNQWTGLVYVPTIEMAGTFDDRGIDKEHFVFKKTELNTGLVLSSGDAPKDAGTSALVAWDPVTQKPRWTVPTPGVWNGGTMTTAGGLVFQGQADGRFNAYDALTGKQLWTQDVGIGISGAPITYTVGGHQYVTVVAGWGAAGPAYLGSLAAQHGWVARRQTHQLLTFVLDGHAPMPKQPSPEQAIPLDEPTLAIDPMRAKAGEAIYATRCLACHGLGVVAAGFAPDLRASAVAMSATSFAGVVRGGALELNNMPKFDELSVEDVESLRLYIRARARATLSVH